MCREGNRGVAPSGIGFRSDHLQPHVIHWQLSRKLHGEFGVNRPLGDAERRSRRPCLGQTVLSVARTVPSGPNTSTYRVGWVIVTVTMHRRTQRDASRFDSRTPQPLSVRAAHPADRSACRRSPPHERESMTTGIDVAAAPPRYEDDDCKREKTGREHPVPRLGRSRIKRRRFGCRASRARRAGCECFRRRERLSLGRGRLACSRILCRPYECGGLPGRWADLMSGRIHQEGDKKASCDKDSNHAGSYGHDPSGA